MNNQIKIHLESIMKLFRTIDPSDPRYFDLDIKFVEPKGLNYISYQ